MRRAVTKEQKLANPNLNPLWREINSRHPNLPIEDIDYICNLYVMTSESAGKEAEERFRLEGE